MNALPTLLKALTKRASGNAACRRSISESFGPVKKRRTPSTGGSSAIGFVVSITIFPRRFAAPAPASASSAARPATASTTVSAHAAASAGVPVGIPASFPKAAIFSRLRLPIRTS